MSGVRSKRKGKRFEDRIAKLIRDKWNLTKDECHRAQSSGTFQTDYSDIYLKPNNYLQPHLIIECKYRNPKVLTYNKILYPAQELVKWYEQIKQSSTKYIESFGIEPIKVIIYSAPNMRPISAITFTDYSELVKNSEPYNLNFLGGINYHKLSMVSEIRTCKGITFIQFFADELFEYLIRPIPKK